MKEIADFIDDHWKWFGFYPMEVEINNKVYTWEEYWLILDEGRDKE